MAIALLAAWLQAGAAHGAVTTLEKRVAASADDAEESPDGTMSLSSGDLELVQDSNNQKVGMRWTGITIPKGANIVAAYVQFSAKESQSEATSLTLRGQATGNAAAFSSSSGNISSRALTSASVGWAPASWSSGQTGAAQRTPDIKALIQQIVNGSSWTSGNSLVIVITGTGHRTPYSFNGNASLAPLLHLEYDSGTSPPADAPPVARLSVTKASSPALTAIADGSASTDTDATPIASYRFTFGDGSSAFTTAAPIATATHTYTSTGTYTVTLIATDTAGNASAPTTASVSFAAPTVTTVERRTAASSDDAEESPSGSVGTSSSDLELTHDSSGDQVVGMRWTSLGIPRGAVIRAAYINFAAKESQTEATNLTFRGQASDNAATFTSSSSGVSSRPRTSASVGWTPGSWSSGSAGSSQRTPELKSLIQEVVNRSSWGTSSALAIIVTGTGRRTAWSYDGNSSQSPLLHVEFEGSGTSPPPPPPPPPPPTSGPIAVYAGYYDTHHSSHLRSKPNPWRGSSNVIFVGTPDPGTSNDWDSSAIRIDNLTSSSISSVGVTVNIGSKRFALWSPVTIPAGGRLILAQTGFENFDGSDTSPAGCVDCSPTLCVTQVSSTVPVVHVTYGGKTTDYYDSGQVLNTNGVDLAGCPYTGTRNDESTPWQQILPRAAAATIATNSEGERPALDAVSTPGFWLGAPFPNPNHGELGFSFRVGQRGMVRLAVFDVSGRLVRVLVDNVLEPGEYRGHADLGAAPSGIYFCDMRSDEGQARERFTIVR